MTRFLDDDQGREGGGGSKIPGDKKHTTTHKLRQNGDVLFNLVEIKAVIVRWAELVVGTKGAFSIIVDSQLVFPHLGFRALI